MYLFIYNLKPIIYNKSNLVLDPNAGKHQRSLNQDEVIFGSLNAKNMYAYVSASGIKFGSYRVNCTER